MGRQSAEAQRIRDAYAAYAQYLQGLPGQIQGLYQSAGSDQAALAKGFSDGMQHTAGATAAEVNAELARMGAPEGQQIPASQATGAGDVLYGVGGYIPGNALTTSGAAFASAAAFMGPNALKAGMLESQKYLTDSKKALTEYDLKIAEIVGDQSKTAYEIRTARKEARAKYKSDLAKAKADARKEAADAAKDADMSAYRWASLDLRQKAAILSDKRAAQRIFQAQKRLGLTARNQSFNQWAKKQTLAQGEVRLGQAQQRLDSPGSTKAKYTTSQKVEYGSAAAAWADYVFGGGEDEDGTPIQAPGPIQALKKIRKEDFPAEFGIDELIRRAPKMKARILAAAKRLGLLPKGAAARSGDIALPLSTSPGGGSEFSYADPEGAPDASGARHHAAKDWFAPGGSPVYAPEGGKVVEVKASRGNSGQVFGGVVKVQTADGRVWVFRHVDPRRVRVGQRVTAGSPLATVSPWTDGRAHAHIELWRTYGGGYRFENMIDPMTFFSRSV
jgi:murein DD-endopeptidase MepM/ murein hydrolase activator NlpD